MLTDSMPLSIPLDGVGGCLRQSPRGFWVLDRSVNGKRFKMTTGTRDLETARVIASSMVTVARRSRAGRLSSIAFCSGAFEAARVGAKKRGIPWEISPAEVARVIKRADGICEVTGVAFDLNYVVEGAHKKHPFAPSLDRVDSTKGYIDGNVRLVCIAANFAMNQWGEAVLYRLAEGMAMSGRINVRQFARVGKMAVCE